MHKPANAAGGRTPGRTSTGFGSEQVRPSCQETLSCTKAKLIVRITSSNTKLNLFSTETCATRGRQSPWMGWGYVDAVIRFFWLQCWRLLLYARMVCAMLQGGNGRVGSQGNMAASVGGGARPQSRAPSHFSGQEEYAEGMGPEGTRLQEEEDHAAEEPIQVLQQPNTLGLCQFNGACFVSGTHPAGNSQCS